MEAIVLGVINLLLLAGKFAWDWWIGKKADEKRAREKAERDKELAEMVRELAKSQRRRDNRGLVKLEDRLQEWINRPIDK